MVLDADDPWWQAHYPPNGWGCQCTVHALNQRDLERLGKSSPDKAPDIDMQQVTVGQRSPGGPRVVETPAGVDPGFAYRPGRASWADTFTPRQAPTGGLALPLPGMPAANTALPAVRPAPADAIMPVGLKAQEYIDAFLEEFDAGNAPAVFKDVTGERVIISDQLFRNAQGELKIFKRGREIYTRLYTATIKEPDEIWVTFVNVDGRAQIRRRYLARWQIEGQELPSLVIYELGGDVWNGVSAFKPDTIRDLLKGGRRGIAVYRRE